MFLKFMQSIYESEDLEFIFYTNDVFLTIDIILREIQNLENNQVWKTALLPVIFYWPLK